MGLLPKVISGGQTGVDRAALDVAIRLGLSVGGWCPAGRRAEDGRIPEHYPLAETRSPEVHVRTQRNVETSSATLVLAWGAPMGGTRYTVEYAESMRRPLLVVDLFNPGMDPVDMIIDWIDENQPRVLNIAGPRESGAPGIGDRADTILHTVFSRLIDRRGADYQDAPRRPSHTGRIRIDSIIQELR